MVELKKDATAALEVALKTLDESREGRRRTEHRSPGISDASELS
jgi:hypothetical protein